MNVVCQVIIWLNAQYISNFFLSSFFVFLSGHLHVPEDYNGPHAYRAVNHVLGATDENKVRIRRIRICVCGQYQSGKSSLLDTLRHKKHQDDRSRTAIADVYNGMMISRNGVLQETRANPADSIKADIVGRIRQDKQRRMEEEQRRPMGEEAERRQAMTSPQRQKKHPKGISSLAPRREIKKPPDAATGQDFPRAASPNQSSTEDHSSSKNPSGAQDQPAEIQELDSSEFQKQLLEDLRKNPQTIGEVGDKEVIISVWDSGGQAVFSSVQHMLMDDEYVVYLLCFNAFEDLKDIKTEQGYFLPAAANTGERTSKLEVPECLENIDHVRHWLTAIHIASQKQSMPQPPPVILVGTHADRIEDLEQRKTELWKELDEHCQRCPMFHSMKEGRCSTSSADSLYLINNKASGQGQSLSTEVQRLSDHINEAVDSILLEKEVPKKFVKFELALQYLRKQQEDAKAKGKDFPGYVSRGYLAKLAEVCCLMTDQDEVEKMLLFYDSIRLIIYKPRQKNASPGARSEALYDDEEIVFFDMKWLIDRFKQLLYGEKFLFNKEEAEQVLKMRRDLWRRGILDKHLITEAWSEERNAEGSAEAAQKVNRKVIETLAAWDMLYGLEDGSGYIVPSALMVRPTHTIVESMRTNPWEASREPDQLVISTADVPLMFMIHPDEHDSPFSNDPDIPLPHSCFFRLVVCLMKKWNMKNRQTRIRLSYNSAWLTVPSESLQLVDFDGDVSVFLGHYELSGAIVLSAQIIHPAKTFRSGHLTMRTSECKIAYVLCRICSDVSSIISHLYGNREPHPRVFVVPFPPRCGCDAGFFAPGACSPQSNVPEKHPKPKDLDLGHVPWKIRLSVDVSKVGTCQPSWIAGDFCSSESCGGERKKSVPPNAHSWLDPQNVFEVSTFLASVIPPTTSLPFASFHVNDVVNPGYLKVKHQNLLH